MACAPQIPAHQIADKGPGTKLTPADRELLQQPFALAVQSMGFDRPDLIVYAAKLLQLQNRPLQAPTVMIEAEDLQERERRGKSLPPLEKPKADDCYGSDGESEGGSLEYYDANEGSLQTTNTDSDLQTDCAEPEPAQRLKVPEMVPLPQVKEPSVLKAAEMHAPNTRKAGVPKEARLEISHGMDVQNQKRKLQVLRSENKRLKERQMCRHCHDKPLSITFLPCGHYAYCYDCGQTFSACPICRKTILADVRTFLA